MILEAYLNAFAKACAKAGGWYALDLFARTGRNWSTTRDREITTPLLEDERDALLKAEGLDPPEGLPSGATRHRRARYTMPVQTLSPGI